MSAFHLEKYYMDCITPAGDLFIGYAARLHWMHLSVTGANTLLKPAGKPALQESSLTHITLPRYANGTLHWRNPFPAVSGTWEGAGFGFAEDLSCNRNGILHWDCLQPAARANVVTDGGTAIAGPGYTEKITLTLKPWDLGIQELAWGHFSGNGHCLVWLHWRGGGELAFAHHNGTRHATCKPEAGGVLFPGGSVTFTSPEPVRTGKVISTVFRHIPLLHDALADGLRALAEDKQIARAELQVTGESPVAGWAVFERITW